MRLKLPDGSYYGSSGTVEFSQVLVDQSTGTVTLRARFANPQSILLPGMFVTAEFAQAIDTSAFLVPQQAVSRDPQGNATLFVVGPGNRAVQRTIVADRTQGPYWVVTQGLAPGEKVITQGTANLRDGAEIKPVPQSAPQRVKAPPPGAVKARQREARRLSQHVADFHRTADLRLGSGDHHHAGRHRRDLRRFPSRNIPTSRRPRSTFARPIPARRLKLSRAASRR